MCRSVSLSVCLPHYYLHLYLNVSSSYLFSVSSTVLLRFVTLQIQFGDLIFYLNWSQYFPVWKHFIPALSDKSNLMPGTNKEFSVSGNLCIHRPPSSLSSFWNLSKKETRKCPGVGGRCWSVADYEGVGERREESVGTEARGLVINIQASPASPGPPPPPPPPPTLMRNYWTPPLSLSLSLPIAPLPRATPRSDSQA